MKLLFATQNKNKVEEIKQLIGSQHELITLADLNYQTELEESSTLLIENALQKANYIYHHFNMNCFSEDTGLEIEELNGAPGAMSARYAGEEKNADENMNKILLELKNVTQRAARFRTVIALVIDGKEFLYEGFINGTITTEKRGTNGFGYDPVFQPDGFTKTFAEMSREEKNGISHRAIAFAKMKEFLESEFAE